MWTAVTSVGGHCENSNGNGANYLFLITPDTFRYLTVLNRDRMKRHGEFQGRENNHARNHYVGGGRTAVDRNWLHHVASFHGRELARLYRHVQCSNRRRAIRRCAGRQVNHWQGDRKSTRLNSS